MKKKIASMVSIPLEVYAAAEWQTRKNKLRNDLIVPKGHVPVSPVTIKEGRHSDDFVQNLITAIVQQFVIRAPRFMYNRYLRLKKSTRNLVQ